MSIGFLPTGGGTQRLADIAGAGVAKELILAGYILDAGEADELNIVNHAHPPAAFDDAVSDIAANIAEKAPLVLRHQRPDRGCHRVHREARHELSRTLNPGQNCSVLSNPLTYLLCPFFTDYSFGADRKDSKRDSIR